jgi:ABC transport system ATP-binding/permease protein
VLRADAVEMVLPEGRRILGPAGLAVVPGTLTGLVGPSGSGKTTLLRILAGIAVPTAGAVTLDGDEATRRVADLGYVPQRETVHGRLTVTEALRYAARLRLDAGADVEKRVRQVLRELDMVEQAETRVGDLSGGERRRVACGLELVGHPRVLLLDEPTSGLDPVLERRLMLMLRHLADQGRAVVVSTHATASLDLCDQVAVMDRGQISMTQSADAAVAALRRAAGEDEGQEIPAPLDPPRSGASKRSFWLEFGVLVGRYRRTLLRDTRTLRILLLQAPIIGFLLALLFHGGAFDRSSGEPANAVQMIFLLMTGAIWLGITSSCREVVKERGIIEREFDVGLRSDAYVLAKAVVLCVLSTVQTLLMILVVLLLHRLDVSFGDIVVISALAILTSWVSVTLGLVVSTLARSVDQAAGVVPLVLIPQLVFAGAVIPLERMPGLANALAQAVYARWSYAGMGSAMDLDGRISSTPGASEALGFGRSFFRVDAVASAAGLVCFLIIFLMAAGFLLQWRAPDDES